MTHCRSSGDSGRSGRPVGTTTTRVTWGLARAAGLCCRHAVAHAPPGRGPEPTLIGQNCYPAGFPLTKQRRTAAEHGTWTFRARPRTSILPDARHPALHMAMPRAIQHHTFPKYTLNDTISPLETSLEWTNVYCTSFNPAAARLPDPIPPRRVSRRRPTFATFDHRSFTLARARASQRTRGGLHSDWSDTPFARRPNVNIQVDNRRFVIGGTCLGYPVSYRTNSGFQQQRARSPASSGSARAARWRRKVVRALLFLVSVNSVLFSQAYWSHHGNTYIM